MRMQNEDQIRKGLEEMVHQNRSKRDQVKKQEIDIKFKLDKFKLQREIMCKGQVEQRVERENEKVQSAEQKLRLLEGKEKAILERLKNTQMTESKA